MLCFNRYLFPPFILLRVAFGFMLDMSMVLLALTYICNMCCCSTCIELLPNVLCLPCVQVRITQVASTFDWVSVDSLDWFTHETGGGTQTPHANLAEWVLRRYLRCHLHPTISLFLSLSSPFALESMPPLHWSPFLSCNLPPIGVSNCSRLRESRAYAICA